jgi:hypothetical protein
MSSARLPEILRPFSREYHEVSGCEVTRVMMVHPAALGEFVDAGYVGWLEDELTRARENAGG